MSEQSFQKSMKELRESTGLKRKEFCENSIFLTEL